MSNSMRFIIFIIIAITTYSLLNYYFIKKNKNILNIKSLPSILLRLVLFTLILAPVATIIFSVKEIPLMAAVAGFTGYSWLAFLFLFLVVHGSVDIILFIAEKAGFRPSEYIAKKILAVTIIVSMSVLIYGYHEAKTIIVERMFIKSSKIPKKAGITKIAQISDVHFSPIISVDTAERIVDIVQKENPDIIISTGDLLDRAIRNRREVAAVLRRLSAPLGKYAITGNHEFIAGIENSMNFIGDSGFVLLRNRAVLIKDVFYLAGVDDLSAAQLGINVDEKELEMLSGLEHDKYVILLKHQPRINKKTQNFFDLQLSGHTHAGQIFPFTGIVKLMYPYTCGLYHIGERAILYVNRGTGSWGPPVRFLAPPEITIIELEQGNQFEVEKSE